MSDGQAEATCGDFGGVNSLGKPCGRQAGWGTDRDEGPCTDHTIKEPDRPASRPSPEVAGPPEEVENPERFDSTPGAGDPKCGDFGGVSTKTGKPCGREAGWGTGETGEGRCVEHTEEAEADRDRIKGRFLDLLRSGKHTKISAARAVGINPGTVWKWGNGDPEFKAAVDEADLEGMRSFLSEWQYNVRERILAGRCAAALERFYITNIDKRISDALGRPRRWRYRQHMEISGPEGGPVRLERIDVSKLEDHKLTLLEKLLEQAAADDAMEVPAREEEGRQLEAVEGGKG